MRKKAQYITDHTGKRVGIVLDLRTFERMQDEIDAYYCKRAYEKAKPATDAEIRRGEFISIGDLTPPGRRNRRVLKNTILN